MTTRASTGNVSPDSSSRHIAPRTRPSVSCDAMSGVSACSRLWRGGCNATCLGQGNHCHVVCHHCASHRCSGGQRNIDARVIHLAIVIHNLRSNVRTRTKAAALLAGAPATDRAFERVAVRPLRQQRRKYFTRRGGAQIVRPCQGRGASDGVVRLQARPKVRHLDSQTISSGEDGGRARAAAEPRTSQSL